MRQIDDAEEAELRRLEDAPHDHAAVGAAGAGSAAHSAAADITAAATAAAARTAALAAATTHTVTATASATAATAAAAATSAAAAAAAAAAPAATPATTASSPRGGSSRSPGFASDQFCAPNGTHYLVVDPASVQASLRDSPHGPTLLATLPSPIDVGGTIDAVQGLKIAFNAAVSSRFQVKLGSGVGGAGASHFTRKLVCTRCEAPSPRGAGTSCQWYVSYTLVDGRLWVLSGASPCARGQPGLEQVEHTEALGFHNHAFYSSMASATSSTTAHVPEWLDKVAQVMAKSNQPCATIRDTLTAGWKDKYQVEPVPWGVGDVGYKFLYHRYCQTGGSLDVDFSNLLRTLEERQKNQGLPYFLDHDLDTIRMSRMYVALAGGTEEWAVGGANNVLLFDPTWGTNLYRWKLCMIATVSATGETVILAYALLEDETALAFEWVFKCVSQHLLSPPSVVFSDHDDKIESALVRMKDNGVWPAHKHFLCVYHISKNFFQHLRGLFLAEGGGKLWKAVHDRFWKITKNTDSRFCELFEAEWQALVDMVHATATNKDKLVAELEWLKRLGVIAPRFVYCFTWATCTLGMHSTQRIESMQRVSKSVMHLNTRSKLLDVQQAMEGYNADKRSAMAVTDVRRSLRQASVAVAQVISSVQATMTSYAFNLVLSQATEAVHYRSDSARAQPCELPAHLGVTGSHMQAATHTFTVSRTHELPMPELQYDQAGNVVSWNCPADYGVSAPEPTGGREVSLTIARVAADACLLHATCTCQFGKSWGVDFCRHVQHCMTVMQVQRVATDLCHIPKWGKVNDLQAIVAEHALRFGFAGGDGVNAAGFRVVADPPPSSTRGPRASARIAGVAASWGSLSLRKAHLLDVHGAVLTLGCGSDLLCDHVHGALTALRKSALELSERATAEAAGSQPPDSLGPPPPPVASHQPHFAWLPHATKAAILKVLGVQYTVEACSPFGGPSADGASNRVLGQQSADRSELVDRDIVCLWPKKNAAGELLPDGQSGWLIGKVRTYSNIAFAVHYGQGDGDDDEDIQYQHLTEASCLNYRISDPIAKQATRAKDFDWYLLAPRGVHHVPRGDQQQIGRPANPARGQKGRPNAEARRAPVAGPTSMAAAAAGRKRKGVSAGPISPCRASPRSVSSSGNTPHP